MRYDKVCVESISYTLPEEVVTTAEIESRLFPLYSRLRLPEGRLGLLTGISERRIWRAGTTPGQQSVVTVRKLLESSGIDPLFVGVLIHGSVCRDYLEPATACGVHNQLGLSEACLVYDVSNACLGLLSGVIQIANMIELGQVRAGIVVGTESSRSLMEATIQYLNTDQTITRKSVKPAFASLTIGSGSAAILLVSEDISRTGNKLVGGAIRTRTKFCDLCRSNTDQTGGDAMNPLMDTDSEALLREGVAVAADVFDDFLGEVNWSVEDIDRIFCHQVGKAHQQALFEKLNLPEELNFSTLEFLGNTGSVALPITAGIGLERGIVKAGSKIAMLGIGSGINVIMLGMSYNQMDISKNSL
ncbi:MAG: 3-oxoacyl-ACP synthase III [Planctomycetaceae bacterium]|jgi:3-oxoacyl-[acyl-carrier-protein] synthase-3|nr:3-oxoacyl-ACP synthase III [Planctomycetaceae bacterium]